VFSGKKENVSGGEKRLMGKKDTNIPWGEATSSEGGFSAKERKRVQERKALGRTEGSSPRGEESFRPRLGGRGRD